MAGECDSFRAMTERIREYSDCTTDGADAVADELGAFRAFPFSTDDIPLIELEEAISYLAMEEDEDEEEDE